MRFDRFVVVAMLLVKVGAAGESASGLEPPVPLFLESFECGDARRWSAVAGGTVPPGPPVGVFVPEVALQLVRTRRRRPLHRACPCARLAAGRRSAAGSPG